MTPTNSVSRRSFLSATAMAGLASRVLASRRIPVGLELYSVRDDLKKDLMGTVRAVAKLAYEVVEFYAPYFRWTPDYAKDVKKLLDDLGIKCLSTHNDSDVFHTENFDKAIELNQTIGSRFIVMASPGKVTDANSWKAVAERLNQANAKFKTHGIRAGYHNHSLEWKPVEGQKPLEILAANTDHDVVLQLDVGTCLETGNDPVAWINRNPGRIVSMHCKDWSPEGGYKVLFGEGVAQWARIFEAAEKTGGIEYYLIEQEGSAYPPLETAERCLATFRKIHKQPLG